MYICACIRTSSSMSEHVKLGSSMQNCWNRNVLKKNEGERRKGEEKKSDRGKKLLTITFFFIVGCYRELERLEREKREQELEEMRRKVISGFFLSFLVSDVLF